MRRRRAPVITGPLCGSCRERPGTITLRRSGLRRCEECFRSLGLTEAHKAATAMQPEIAGVRSPAPESQPFASARNVASKVAEDFKAKAAGKEVA